MRLESRTGSRHPWLPWLLLFGLGGALAIAAAGLAPRLLAIMFLLGLVGLIALDFVLIPEPRVPKLLVGATIVGIGLAAASSVFVADLLAYGRFLPPALLCLVVMHWRIGARSAVVTGGQRAFVVALASVVALSAFVSVDRRTTTVKALAMAVMVLAIVCALRWMEHRRTSLRGPVLTGLLVLVFSNLAALLAGIGTFSLDRYRGWTINPNTLGIMCGLAMPVLAATAITTAGRRRIWCVLGFLVTFAVLLMTGSRSSLLGALGGLLVVVRIGRLTRSVIFPMLLVLAIMVAPLALRAANDAELLRPVERAGESGREEVWPVAWEEILRRPVFGAGFATTETRFLAGEFGSFDVFQGAQFHNSYLEAGVELGILGGLLLLLAGAYAVSHLFRRGVLQNAWAAALAVTTGTIGIFETGLLTPGSMLFFPFWLSLGILARADARRASDRGRSIVEPVVGV